MVVGGLSGDLDDMMNLHLPNADVRLDAGFLTTDEADALLAALASTVPWEQRDVVVQGRTYAQPRLTAWFGDSDEPYTYSGLTLHPNAWTPELERLRDMIETRTGVRFNSALANRYRSNRDSIGMHSDSERELGPDPIIGSISLGREREFVMAPKKGRAGRRTPIRLPHGSLLMMGAGTQINWMHGIDKEAVPSDQERINITFRTILERTPK